MNLEQGIYSYMLLFVAGFVATEPWRYLGVLLSKNLNVESEILNWFRAVSTALIAGLVTRMVFFPLGVLTDVPLTLRLASFAFGISVYFLMGQRLFAGVFSGGCLLVISAFFVI